MSVPRIPLTVAQAIDEQRKLGRSNSQIEKIVGLPSGALSRPYLVDDSAERRAEEIQREVEEWRRRDDRFWAAQRVPQRPQGWRPMGNCVVDRPNAGRHFRPKGNR